VVKLDDQSLIVPIHGLSAVWGILAAALFADGRYGKGWNGVGVGEYLGVTGQGVTGYLTPSDVQPDFPQQMYAQLVGLLAIVVVSFFVSWLVFKLMSSFVRTREGAGLEPSTFSGSSEALSSATTPTSPASGVLAEGKSPGQVG
jgi:Amt family ammonium transporter